MVHVRGFAVNHMPAHLIRPTHVYDRYDNMDDALLTQLTNVFREVFADDALCVSRATTASDVKGWNSLKHITLMLSVQRAFRVRFSAAETSQLRSVGELIDLVHAKQGRG